MGRFSGKAELRCGQPAKTPSPKRVIFLGSSDGDLVSLGTFFQAFRGKGYHNLEGLYFFFFLTVTNPIIIWQNAGAGMHGDHSSMLSLLEESQVVFEQKWSLEVFPVEFIDSSGRSQEVRWTNWGQTPASKSPTHAVSPREN